MNGVLQNIFNETGKFGEIIVSTHSSEESIVRKKETQAQTVVAQVRSMSFDNLSFVLQLTIDAKLDNVTGCTLLSDGRMVFSCYKQNCVRGFNRDGSRDFDISLPSTCTFDITYINDNNTFAVTSGGGTKKCISIIDVESRKVEETIPVGYDSCGIISRNNTLIYCAAYCGMQMIDLTDKSVNNIGRIKMSRFAYVTTFGDKLYYRNADTDTVTCCDFHGTTQWEFKDKSVLDFPQGIAVDNAGNVYVVGWKSYNLVVISPDGQRHRQLLSDKDGIISPNALYYDRTTNQLLVANDKGKAFHYRLE